MKHLRSYITILLLLILSEVAIATPSSQVGSVTPEPRISDLSQWIRMKPSDYIGNYNLYSSREFMNAVLQALGMDKYRRFVRQISVNHQLCRISVVAEDYLHFSICRIHRCNEFHLSFFINPKESKVYICGVFPDYSKKDEYGDPLLESAWYSPKGKYVLANDSSCLVSWIGKDSDVHWKKWTESIPKEVRY